MSIQNLTSHSNQANRGERQSAVVAVAAADSSRPLYGWIAWFTVLVVVSLMATRATGQVAKTPFESIPMHPALQDEKKVKQVEALTKQFANTGQGNAASVNGYFAFYLPAKMTAPDGVKHISDLMSDATSLLGRAERSNNPQVLQVVRRYIFDGMKKVAEGNYHPAARINAILMLSRLNSQPANLQNKTAPVPLAEALPILMQMYQNEQNVDGVRAAALQGIRRQTMYGFPQISQQNRQAISQIAKDLLDSTPPAGRSEKAHAFLQRSAVDILDVLKPQDDKQLATKLVSLSTESNQPDLIALYAAQRLGAMAADLQGQVDKPEDLVQSWTKRILQAYENDLKRINALERPRTNVSQPPKPETFLQTRVQETPTNTGDAGMRMDMDETEMSGMEMNMMEDREESGDDMEGMEGMMGGMMAGMMGNMMGEQVPDAKPQPPEVRVSRGKLNSVIQQVHLALTGKAALGKPAQPGGLLAAVSEEKKPVIEDWLAEMEPIVTELNDPTLDDREKWVDKLTEQIELLKEMVGEDDEAVNLPDDSQPEKPADAVDPAAAEDPAAPADDLEIVNEIGG